MARRRQGGETADCRGRTADGGRGRKGDKGARAGRRRQEAVARVIKDGSEDERREATTAKREMNKRQIDNDKRKMSEQKTESNEG